MNDRWFISDNHFGHVNMLRFERADGSLVRPGFRDVDHMDEVMIEKWNSVVKPQDVVHHLGDICFDQKHLTKILPRLHGKIYLVLGNHDRLDAGFYDKHFKKVRGWFHFTEPGAAMICTHCPLHESSFLGRYRGTCINVHGHIHARVIRDPKYVNVSVEQIDYTPVHYDTLMAKARGMSIEKKPPRNPDVLCPDCGCKWLYTDYYDQCYECGRQIGSETSARSAGAELDSEAP